MTKTALIEALRAEADAFVAIRRDIHQHPELGYKEHRTSDLVAEKLSAWGYQVHRGLGGTGVVGQLVRGNGTRKLGLRADMDALPMQEETGLPYASCHHGVMHACGHDGHTAMLLAAAHHLAQHGQFNGTLNVIFQPAEEGLGGAKKMQEDGLFQRFPCDAVFGMHNMPGYTPGHLVLRDGAFMASSDTLEITITGNGGHGALPHLAVDPVVAGSALVMGLQTIVSRNVSPMQSAVITVGAFVAGEAPNIIPHSALLRLSVRSLDRDVRKVVLQRIEDMVHQQAAAYGCSAEIKVLGGYPVLVNTTAETEFARQIAVELVGADQVILQGEQLTGSEDFAFFLEEVPGSYLLIGNGDKSTGGHGACSVHNPNYDFQDSNIPIGAAYWVHLTERFLA